MTRAALFDAVGTLIHLREPVGDTYARLAREHGIELSAPAIQAAFGRRLRSAPPMVFPGLDAAQVRAAERAWWRALVRGVFTDAGAGEPLEFEPCFDRLFDHFARAAAWRCADGAAGLLRTLRRGGRRTGMVSNFDHRLRPLLGELGLAALLEVVVLPADAGAAKPDRRIFAVALERLAVRADEAVYVGDDAEDDLHGAERAGLRAIDVRAVSHLNDLAALIEA